MGHQPMDSCREQSEACCASIEELVEKLHELWTDAGKPQGELRIAYVLSLATAGQAKEALRCCLELARSLAQEVTGLKDRVAALEQKLQDVHSLAVMRTVIGDGRDFIATRLDFEAFSGLAVALKKEKYNGSKPMRSKLANVLAGLGLSLKDWDDCSEIATASNNIFQIGNDWHPVKFRDYLSKNQLPPGLAHLAPSLQRMINFVWSEVDPHTYSAQPAI